MDLLEDPLPVAAQLVRDRFPEARAAFLAGSVLTERRTVTSDLDVVVVLGGPPAPFRESLLYEGWPAELLCQTEQSWHDFAERETAARSSPLLAMCADGVLLVDADGVGAALQEEARRRLAAGPPAASVTELEDRRYVLTDSLDDLRGCADPLERAYIVADVLRRAAELVLLARGHWLGGGKWLSRRLAAADPDLHARLTAAASAALAPDASAAPGASAAFAAAVHEVLTLAGGPLWSGYTRGVPTGPTRST